MQTNHRCFRWLAPDSIELAAGKEPLEGLIVHDRSALVLLFKPLGLASNESKEGDMMNIDMTAQLAPMIWSLVAALSFLTLTVVAILDPREQVVGINTTRLAVAVASLVLVGTLVSGGLETAAASLQQWAQLVP